MVKTSRFKLLFVLAVSFVFLSSTIARADWVNDWIQQKTSVSPDYFQGQKRGYMTGGSFSARWSGTNTWSPVTLSPPSIKVGCGGINLFGGGFGFVNPEYLVHQLQAMLQAAPAVAFDIALNTLCSPCSKAIKAIQAITDRLNGLQLNNCLLTRALTVKALDPLAPSKLSSENKRADQTLQTMTGAVNMFTDIFRKEEGSTSGTSQPANAQSSYQDMISGCPTDLKDLYGTADKTLLEQAAAKVEFSQNYVDLIRGLVGDLQFQAKKNKDNKPQLIVAYVKPCNKNKSSSIDDFLNGKVQKKNGGGYCSPAMTINLQQWVENKMATIAIKLKNGSSLTPEEESIIKVSPIPVYSAIKAAVASDQVAPTVALLADVTARAYAYGSMSDLYNIAIHLLYYARSVTQKQGQSQSPHCQVQILNHNDAINQFIKTVYKRQEDIKMDYIKVVSEVNTLQSLVNNYRLSRNIVTASLLKNINGSAVAKVVK